MYNFFFSSCLVSCCAEKDTVLESSSFGPLENVYITRIPGAQCSNGRLYANVSTCLRRQIRFRFFLYCFYFIKSYTHHSWAVCQGDPQSFQEPNQQCLSAPVTLYTQTHWETPQWNSGKHPEREDSHRNYGQTAWQRVRSQFMTHVIPLSHHLQDDFSTFVENQGSCNFSCKSIL